MKTKWLYADIIGSFVMVLFFAGVDALIWYGAFESFLKPVAVAVGVLVTVMILILFFKHGVFQVMKFDENGFYFYDIFGLRGFCAWESIEKAEYHRSERTYESHIGYGHRRRYGRYRPVYITVYNNEHFLVPDIDENNRVKNRDLRGYRFKVNKQDSELAWIIGLNTGSKKTFTEFFGHYRPDLFIERNSNMIYDE